jgi:hypothetical protein
MLPSTSGSSKWSLSVRFPHQNPVYSSPLPHTCYKSHPSHLSVTTVIKQIVAITEGYHCYQTHTKCCPTYFCREQLHIQTGLLTIMGVNFNITDGLRIVHPAFVKYCITMTILWENYKLFTDLKTNSDSVTRNILYG